MNYSVTGYTRTQLFLNTWGTEQKEIEQNGNNNNNDTKAYIVVVWLILLLYWYCFHSCFIHITVPIYYIILYSTCICMQKRRQINISQLLYLFSSLPQIHFHFHSTKDNNNNNNNNITTNDRPPWWSRIRRNLILVCWCNMHYSVSVLWY